MNQHKHISELSLPSSTSNNLERPIGIIMNVLLLIHFFILNYLPINTFVDNKKLLGFYMFENGDI